MAEKYIKTGWFKDKFSEEHGEFERTVSNDIIGSFFRKGETEAEWDARWEVAMKKIKKDYSKARLVELTDGIWKRMENTESWGTTDISKVDKAIRKNAASSKTRNIYNVLIEILGPEKRAPIVLRIRGTPRKPNGPFRYTLIAGNTRLMGSRMLDITPKVVVVNY